MKDEFKELKEQSKKDQIHFEQQIKNLKEIQI